MISSIRSLRWLDFDSSISDENDLKFFPFVTHDSDRLFICCHFFGASTVINLFLAVFRLSFIWLNSDRSPGSNPAPRTMLQRVISKPQHSMATHSAPRVLLAKLDSACRGWRQNVRCGWALAGAPFHGRSRIPIDLWASSPARC